MKLEVKLDIHCERAKMKAIKTISRFTGIDSIAADLKEGKLTVIGDVDPVQVVRKLRKKWHVEILTVGPVKPPEKPKEKEPEVKICSSFYPYNIMPPPYVVYCMEENPNACVIC